MCVFHYLVHYYWCSTNIWYWKTRHVNGPRATLWCWIKWWLKMLYFTVLFCRYYYLAFRAHQTPLASKESCIAILEKSRLDHWLLGKTKVVLSLLFRLSLEMLCCVPRSLISDLNSSVSFATYQTRPQPNSDLCWSWVRSPRISEAKRGEFLSCSACSLRTI